MLPSTMFQMTMSPFVKGMWSALANTVLRSTVLILCTALIVYCRPRMSAARRHVMWTIAFCGVLLLPLLQSVVPRWNLKILPAEAPPTVVRTMSQRPVSFPADVVGEAGRAPHDRAVDAIAFSDTQWLLLLVGIWGGGMLLVLIALLRSQWWVRRFLSTTIPLKDPRLQEMSDQVARIIGVQRLVPLQMHPCAIPMVCGLLRPVLVLPTAARQWDDSRLRHVLLHEFAHIKRFDSLIHLIASLTCALHWFNPFVWMAASRLRLDREQACDDVVLSAGSRPSTYATDLLELAQLFHHRQHVALAALAFTPRSQIQTRLHAVIDTKRSRGNGSRRGLFLTYASALGVVCPIMSLTLQPRILFSARTVRAEIALPSSPCTGSRIGEGDSHSSSTIKERHQMKILPCAALAVAATSAPTPTVHNVHTVIRPTVTVHQVEHPLVNASQSVTSHQDTVLHRVFIPLPDSTTAVGDTQPATRVRISPRWEIQHIDSAKWFAISPGGRAPFRMKGAIAADSASPMLIVNGLRVDPTWLDQIDPNTIGTIEVLKGSAATATYGPDAVHGVIIITTKESDTTK